MDPVSAFGVAVGCVQVAEQLIQLFNLILKKPSDRKTLKSLRDQASRYIDHLKRWQEDCNGSIKDACNRLGDILQEIVDEIDALKNRNLLKKAATSLRIYSPQFQERMANALEEFKIKVAIEGQKESEKRLEELTTEMKALNLTKERLEKRSATKEAISEIDSLIRELAEQIESIKVEQNRIQEAINQLSSLPTLVAQIVADDGNATREFVREVFNEVHNDSVTRINAEVAASSEFDIIRFGEGYGESPLATKIFDLDYPNEKKPSAQVNGIAVSTKTSQNTMRTISRKRHAADKLDRKIQRLKRRKLGDVSQYMGLIEWEGHFQILQKYYPKPLVQMLRELPQQVRRRIVAIVQTLEQEYAYTLLDRIVNGMIYTLPGLAEFEGLERATIALQAEKMSAIFTFKYQGETEFMPYLSDLRIKISRDGYDVQMGEPFFDEIPDPGDLKAALGVSREISQHVWKGLRSTGTNGLSMLMKSCFSVVDRKKGDQTLVVGFFEDLFRELDSSFYAPVDFLLEDAFLLISDGRLGLESCAITTPSTRLRVTGLHIFEDYWLSLTAHAADGAEKVEIFTRAIKSDPNNSTYLKELACAYHQVGQYENAIEIYQKQLLPIASGEERERIEDALGELFMITQDYDAAITLLEPKWQDGGHERRKLLLQACLKAERSEAAKQLAVFMIEKDYGEKRRLISNQVFEAIGDDQMLIQLCENAAHRNPESYDGWYRLADCYKRLKYFEKGIECLKTVCKSSWVSQPYGHRRLDLEFLLAEMYTEVGNHELAIQRMEEVCESSWSWQWPWDKYYVYEKLMDLHLAHGNKELARGAFQRAAAAFMDGWDSFYERNDCWRTLCRYALLFENYDFVINEFPRTQSWGHYESDWENFWMALNKKFGRDVAIKKYAQEIERWRQTIYFEDIPELHVTKVRIEDLLN